MKKLATILALTAIVANMGVAAVFAQTSAVTGTQEIGCPTVTRSFGTGVAIPNSFQIGTLGTRPVSITNDNVHDPSTNSAFFNEVVATPTVFADLIDALTISSNVISSCGAAGSGTKLTVDAKMFTDTLTSDLLMTYGADGTSGDVVGDEVDDYYPIFSVVTSSNATCTGSCLLATGATELGAGLTTFAGNSNMFTNPTAHDQTFTATAPTAVLLNPDSTTPASPVVLYQVSNGFAGDVNINGLDFNLALPSHVNPGTFTSSVTYTLSA